MGLLDDAIREHLELKRRRGADLDEIARQEDEALGDPRSGEFAQPDAEAPEEDLAAEELAPEEEPPAAVVYQPEPEPDPVAPPEPPTREEQPWLEDDRTDPVGARAATDSTQPEPEPDRAPAEGEEDVLEETPDFLQETPEHDRLWFEQKPPRDFDFDS
jgi:hypothetical protein